MKAKLGVRPPQPARVQRQTASAALARKPQPALRIIDGGLDGGSLLRLQAAAGNHAVGELIAGPRLHVQALSLGTLLRPAEAAATAAITVGESAAAAPKTAEAVASVAIGIGEEVAGAPKPGEAGVAAVAAVGEAVAGAPKRAESVGEKAAGPGEGAGPSGKPGDPATAPHAAAETGAAAAKAPATPAGPAAAKAPAGGAAPAVAGPAEAGAAPAGPVETAGEVAAGAGRPSNPRDDPRFAAVAGRVGGVASKQKSHPSARAKVAESENAAKGPGNEVASKAAANKVEEMGAQKPKGFDKAGFIAAVHAAIERKSPKSMKQVDDFTDSGKAAELKGEVVGNVTAGKEAAAGDIKASATA